MAVVEEMVRANKNEIAMEEVADKVEDAEQVATANMDEQTVGREDKIAFAEMEEVAEEVEEVAEMEEVAEEVEEVAEMEEVAEEVEEVAEELEEVPEEVEEAADEAAETAVAAQPCVTNVLY